MNKLILIGGHSGSGKSTMAEKIRQEYIDKGIPCYHYEADDYFYDVDGTYNFNADMLSEAHSTCIGATEDTMSIGGCNIVVSNTFTRQWEVDPYLELAKQYGYEVEFTRCTVEYANIHGVPYHTVQRQKRRMENINVR